MFTTVLAYIVELWHTWAAPFAAIPYGNPYWAAILPLFVIFCAGYFLAAHRRRRKMKLELGDQFERTEIYRRAMNGC